MMIMVAIVEVYGCGDESFGLNVSCRASRSIEEEEEEEEEENVFLDVGFLRRRLPPCVLEGEVEAGQVDIEPPGNWLEKRER